MNNIIMNLFLSVISSCVPLYTYVNKLMSYMYNRFTYLSKIYSVAVDPSVPLSELQLMASDTSKAFTTADSSTLDTIVTDILANSCGNSTYDV